MEVDISAMMVVAALRMVEVVGAAGRPRQMSWYLTTQMLIVMMVVIKMARNLRRHSKIHNGEKSNKLNLC